MPELVIFPDVVDLVVAYLEDNLTPPVRTNVPSPRPATFVRVIRTGGPRSSLTVDDATVVVESWALLPEQAQALAQLARAWIHAAAGTVVGGQRIYSVEEFSGPGLFPDPLSNHARYTQTFVIQTRGAAA